jgi:hypothetical protein
MRRAEKTRNCPRKRGRSSNGIVFRFKMSRNPRASISKAADQTALPFNEGCQTAVGSELIGDIFSGKSRHPVPTKPNLFNKSGRHKGHHIQAKDALATIDVVFSQYQNLPAAAPTLKAVK